MESEIKYKGVTPIGQKFGRLTVITFDKYIEYKTQKKSSWICECTCGTRKSIVLYALTSKLVTSCGCERKERFKKIILKGEIEPKDTIKHIYKKYLSRSPGRNLTFNLTLEQFKTITSLNCYYCGDPPSNYRKGYTKKDGTKGDLLYNSVDRIDSTKGYEIKNCVPCCKLCNTMKMALTQEEFYNHIIKIYKNNQL